MSEGVSIVLSAAVQYKTGMMTHTPGDASTDETLRQLYTAAAQAMLQNHVVNDFWVGFSDGASFGTYPNTDQFSIPNDPLLSPVVFADQQCDADGVCQLLDYFYTNIDTLQTMAPPFLSIEYDVLSRPWFLEGEAFLEPEWGSLFLSSDIPRSPLVCPTVPLEDPSGEFLGLARACVNLTRLGEEFERAFPEGTLLYLAELSEGLPLMAASTPDATISGGAQVLATESTNEAISLTANALTMAVTAGDYDLTAPLGTPGFVHDGYYIQAMAVSKLGSLKIHRDESWVFVGAHPTHPSDFSYSFSGDRSS